MTLLIACLLISGFHMSPFLYALAGLVWMLRVVVYGAKTVITNGEGE